MKTTMLTFVILILTALAATGAPSYYEPVPDIDGLKALGTHSQNVMHVQVRGYHKSSSLGGGQFDWVPGACAPDDGVWIKANEVPPNAGCWHRILNQPNVSPEMFGAQPGSSVDALGALNAAEAYSSAHGGTCIELAAGIYRISATWNVDQDLSCIVGQTQATTKLSPLSVAGGIVVRVTGRAVSLRNFGVVNLAGKGITCFFIGPPNVDTINSNQSNFDFDGLGCEQAYEGFVFRAGGTGSSIYFGQVNNFWCTSCRRTLYFAPGSKHTGANRNTFMNVNSINLGGTPVNVFIDIENGDGNTFIGGSANGTLDAGPLATPTFIRTGPGGTNNKFFGGGYESTKRNLDNNGAGNEFYGQSWGVGSWNFGVAPSNLLCAEPSNCPTITPAYAFQQNSQIPSVPCNGCLYVWNGNITGPRPK
jgi:hypothetical protein